MSDQEGYLDQPLREFLDRLGAGHAAPGGGAAAALAVSVGGRLCAMTARLSARQLTDAQLCVMKKSAARIADDAASLIEADAESFAGVIEARRAADGGQLAAALSRASDVPMRVAELGAEAADLAARLARDGNPALRGDTIAAVLLAQAGVAAAAALVEINLAEAAGDQRPARAARLVRETDGRARAVRQAGQPGSPP
jgi:methenyltetrahydrofolate cyclohydrolase